MEIKYKRLTEREIEDTAQAYFRFSSKECLPQEHPKAVLIGAQPGAGKTGVSRIIRNELKESGGSIAIDADRMRERIDTKGAKPKSQETQADAGALAGRVRELAIAARLNIVEEGTFRVPESLSNYSQRAKAQGYAVELVALATSREESLVGIHQRFEKQHAAGVANPRSVPSDYHDESIDGFRQAIGRHGAEFDRLRVVARSGRELFDSQNQSQKGNALQALIQGQQITDARLKAVAEVWPQVRADAVARGADAGYVAELDGHAGDVFDMQKARIHQHALARVDANVKELGTDPRFQSHQPGELTRAAYYRGFHEKAYEFKSMRPDFKAFDATMSDRQALSKLPEVNDLDERKHPGAQQRGIERDVDRSR